MTKYESRSLLHSRRRKIHDDWKKTQCQPNYWINVSPDPKTSCGPYTPITEVEDRLRWDVSSNISRWNHDTIGMVVIDKHGIVSGGTSTNGMKYKIPGRVGDSPIPGEFKPLFRIPNFETERGPWISFFCLVCMLEKTIDWWKITF